MQLTTGAVVIGRNEGERLVACLTSLIAKVDHIIYVDSGSTDGSVEKAASLGVSIVNLDMTKHFTAARARNAGFKALLEQKPDLTYVQFVDGDCLVAENWIKNACGYLNDNADVAIVCGRRKELHPEASFYNHLCDIEWNTPIGEAKACGGDALMRADILHSIGGFNDTLIAGEEPEMCIRIRQAGYKIWRLDYEMTFHDAAIFKFSQWWKRSMRAGYAFAQGSYMHGAPPEYHWVKESRRSWLWGFILPIVMLTGFLIKPVWGFTVAGLFILQLFRLTFKNKTPFLFSLKQSGFSMIGKIAEAIGQMKFLRSQLSNRQSKLIEYK